MADELLEIADDGSNDTTKNKAGEDSLDAEWMARSRLRVDTRKWLLSKALPKIYGDKTAIVGGSEEDEPVRVITEIKRVIVRPQHQDG